jgi:hypothetical protein
MVLWQASSDDKFKVWFMGSTGSPHGQVSAFKVEKNPPQ